MTDPAAQHEEHETMEYSITLRGFGEEVTVPGRNSGASREYDPERRRIIDVALHVQAMIGYPVGVSILLRSDGTWEHWRTDFTTEGHYWHFYHEAGDGPTEAQRRTLARWWLGFDRPYGQTIGGPVAAWAFGGMTADEVSEKYGDGRKIALTAPCDEHERIGLPADLDESMDREHLLDRAVEEGKIAGADW